MPARSRALSSLELFVLALIQHGINTPYLMLKEADLSVGATTPALKRLESRKLIVRSRTASPPRMEVALSELGIKELRGWRNLLSEPAGDFDQIFRVVALALDEGNGTQVAAEYLNRAARIRRHTADGIEMKAQRPAAKDHPAQVFAALKRTGELARLRFEADFLEHSAKDLKKRSRP